MRGDIKKSWDRFAGGEKEAFGEVFKHYLPLLTLYCLGVLHDEQSAENCATEALVKTYTYRQPKEIKDPEKWLFVVAKNKCISELRKVKRMDSNEPNETSVISQIEDPLVSSDIDQIIMTELDEDEKSIWSLHADGYSNQEMAEQLNSSPKTMANRKSIIRNKLKKAFKKYLDLGKDKD